jgi:hypothetical protein
MSRLAKSTTNALINCPPFAPLRFFALFALNTEVVTPQTSPSPEPARPPRRRFFHHLTFALNSCPRRNLQPHSPNLSPPPQDSAPNCDLFARFDNVPQVANRCLPYPSTAPRLRSHARIIRHAVALPGDLLLTHSPTHYTPSQSRYTQSLHRHVNLESETSLKVETRICTWEMAR